MAFTGGFMKQNLEKSDFQQRFNRSFDQEFGTYMKTIKKELDFYIIMNKILFS